MILKEFTTRISKVKTFLKYARPLKRYSVLKFEFPVIFFEIYIVTKFQVNTVFTRISAALD